MRTRRERSHLILTAGKNYEHLKNKLVNGEVADMAVNLHGILSTISSTYSNEVVVDLILELLTLLSKFEAFLKVNDDLK